MLEKIGLPAKPSMRGSNWVVDASHCQGCASQFTFINRKHHCRRCGGLFCGNCTQQRMVLRGQGDSPVRICEPCKKLEDAARFEMRHAHKTRAARGSTKLASTIEDEILGQIIGNEGKELSSSQLSKPSIERVSSRSACSTSQVVAHLDEGGEVRKSHYLDHPNSINDDLKSTSPEELRQWASDEKKRYKVLKGEGKSDEALKAFKRGKELERQADALEISLRKNRRRVLTAESPTDIRDKDSLKESGRRSKFLGQAGEEKEDLMAELKELGWSDIGSRDDDKKQKNMSLEGELSSLMGEIQQSSVKHVGMGSMDKSQVVAHKKKALALKREGNLAEAKEELKKAKVLEKLLEEQELLGVAEDSDDEISALIHSMGDDKQDELLGYEQDHGFEFDHLVGSVDNIGADANVEVTDEDLMDPEITATLKSLGWTDHYGIPEDSVGLSLPIDREELSSEILSLKQEALNQKHAGNATEAMVLLKKAKLLERDLGNVKSDAGNVVGHSSKIVAPGLTYETSDIKNKVDSKPAPKSRSTIQKELLSLKRKALALKREGRVDEAEEELKKCRVLEQQLEELENTSTVNATQATIVVDHVDLTPEHFIAPAHPPVQEGEEDVTDHDMHDPTYLSLLRNLGWKDEYDDFASSASQPSKKNDNSSVQIAEHPVTQVISSIPPRKSRRSKAEIQRELLGLKRKSLALRREGKTDDAEEVLKAAKVLEAELADLEAPKQDIQVESVSIKGEIVGSANDEGDPEDVTDKDMQDPALISMLKNVGWKDEEVDASHNISAPSQRSKKEIQQDLLGLKRKALAHRRKGENDAAEEMLKMAKVLEGQLEEMEGPQVGLLANSSKDTKSVGIELLTNQEKQHRVKSVVDLSEKLPVAATNLDEQADAFVGFGKKECDANAPSTRSADGIYAITSQSTGDSPALLGEVGFVQSAMKNQGLSSAPPTQQISNIMDLLTGDGWSGSHVPAEKHKDMTNFESNESFALVGSLTTSPKNVGSKEDVTPGRSEEKMNAELYQQCTTQTNSVKLPSNNNGNSLQQEVLARKKKAVALKRQGKLTEAREELRQAKLLEKTLGDGIHEPETRKPDLSTSMPIATTVQEKEPSPSKSAMKPLSGHDRFKLQQESLGHKRQALKLRREGRMEEAEAEFELAKALEAQLEDSASQDPAKPSVNNSDSANDVVVEDLLDPQLLSALKAIGIEDTNDVSPVHERPRDSQKPRPLKVSPGKGDTTNQERIHLEERIRAEKVKALNLKRSGQQAEALDALRRAKLLEKKLNTLGSG